MHNEGTDTLSQPIFELSLTYELGKHGSFGHPGVNTDDLYCAGSDDFRGYVWKIPPTSKLTELRTEMSADEWEAQKSSSTVGTLVRIHISSMV